MTFLSKNFAVLGLWGVFAGCCGREWVRELFVCCRFFWGNPGAFCCAVGDVEANCMVAEVNLITVDSLCFAISFLKTLKFVR